MSKCFSLDDIEPWLPSSSLQTAQLWKKGPETLNRKQWPCCTKKKKKKKKNHPRFPNKTMIKIKPLTRVWDNRTHSPSLLRPAILGSPSLITLTSGSYYIFPHRLLEVHWSWFNIQFSGAKRAQNISICPFPWYKYFCCDWLWVTQDATEYKTGKRW